MRDIQPVAAYSASEYEDALISINSGSIVVKDMEAVIHHRTIFPNGRQMASQRLQGCRRTIGGPVPGPDYLLALHNVL